MGPVYLLAILLVFQYPADARVFGGHPSGHGHHIVGGHHRIPPNETPLDAKCSNTSYPAICAEAAAPFAASYKTLDDKTMLSIIIAASNASARAAAIKAFNLANDLRTPPLVAINVATCPSSFKDALDNLEAAKYGIETNDSGMTTTGLSSLFANYGQCTDIFDEKPTVNPNPMAGDTVNLERLANVALGFAYSAFGIEPPSN